MPINMNDPRILAENKPQSLVDLGNRLKAAYRVGPDAFGIQGNEYHSSGFHRSRNWIYSSPDSRYGTSDYSVQGTRNHGGDGDDCCAFDFTPGSWGTTDNRAKMIDLTRRVHNAALRYDSRLNDWYEFAGTLDGSTVVTFYAQGGAFKKPFDSSHLDHLHGSGYRDNIQNSHAGLGDILLGIGEDEEEMLSIEIRPTGMTSQSLPPVDDGGWPRPAYLNVTNDTNGAQYAVRAWYSKGDPDLWAELPGWGPNGVRVLRNGEHVSAPIPKGCVALTLSRQAVNGVTYDGHLTAAIDFGPVRR